MLSLDVKFRSGFTVQRYVCFMLEAVSVQDFMVCFISGCGQHTVECIYSDHG